MCCYRISTVYMYYRLLQAYVVEPIHVPKSAAHVNSSTRKSMCSLLISDYDV